jgi:hypothetical protein
MLRNVVKPGTTDHRQERDAAYEDVAGALLWMPEDGAVDLRWDSFLGDGAGGDVPVAVSWLRYVEAVRDLMDQVAASNGMTDSQVRVAFAELFVAQVLGDQWVDNRLAAYNGLTTEEHVRFKYQLWRLGRLLFDLQSYDFFGGIVADVKQRDLLGALFEAEVVRLLMQLPTRTTLRVPQGQKGLDYDIDFGGSRLQLAVEVKAKDETTPFTAATVRNTLQTAREQLPRDGLGLIFLRVPYAWTSDPEYAAGIDAPVEWLLRNTSRVQAVVLVWDEIADRTATTMRLEPRQRVLRREGIDPRVDQVLRFLEQVWASDWDAVGPASAF